jgi:anti-anti-sigma factor
MIDDRLPQFTIEVSRTSSRDCLVTLRGELDLAGAPKLAEAFAALIEPRCDRVVVDLGGLSFIDSTGIQTLLVAGEALRARGGVITLRAPSAEVRRVFEIVHLADLMPIEYGPAPEGSTETIALSD